MTAKRMNTLNLDYKIPCNLKQNLYDVRVDESIVKLLHSKTGSKPKGYISSTPFYLVRAFCYEKI